MPESLQDLSRPDEIRGLRRVPPGIGRRARSAGSAVSPARFPVSSGTATEGVRRGSSAPTSAALEQAPASGPGNSSTSANRADSNAADTAAETPHTTGAPFNARLR